MLVVISEAIRVLLIDSLSYESESIYQTLLVGGFLPNIKFNQWQAGYIDGDGYFSYSKKGYVSLEITTHLRDKKALYVIKQQFGGSIKIKSGKTHIRYRLHHKEGLLKLINSVNGELRNPIRLLQFKRLCDKYNIELIFPQPLNYNNGWLSGFIDSDGSIFLSLQSSQIFITGCNNNKCLLDPLIYLYGGNIFMTNKSGLSFKWCVTKKEEILNLIEYFKLYPLQTTKFHRTKQIKDFYFLRDSKAHLKSKTSVLGKLWFKFINKWDKFFI